MDDIKLMPKKYNKPIEKGRDQLKGAFKQTGDSLFSAIAGWSKKLAVLLILCILLAVGLWGYRLFLTNKKEQLSQKIEELQGQRNLALEGDFKEMRKGINNLKSLLANRTYPSSLFEMLEELTLSSTYFTGFEANLSEGKLSLGARASGYTALAKQILIFEQDERIKSVNASSASIDQSGQVISSFEILFDTSLLKNKND